MKNRRIAFRFGKEFTEEQFKQVQDIFPYKNETDLIRLILSKGYKQIIFSNENIAKANKVLDALGLTPEDLKVESKTASKSD
jgi:phosphoglycolate phosphatase-like HAD superfamily hydrolase